MKRYRLAALLAVALVLSVGAHPAYAEDCEFECEWVKSSYGYIYHCDLVCCGC